MVERTAATPAMLSRREIENTLEMLIDLLDQMDADPDIEDDEREPDEDGEPEMGATTDINQEAAWDHLWEAGWCGCTEPSLGAPENIDQTNWNQGPGNEEEEPTMARMFHVNQEHPGEGNTNPNLDECEAETDKDDADENEAPPRYDPVGLHRENAEGRRTARKQLRTLMAMRRCGPLKFAHPIEAEK